MRRGNDSRLFQTLARLKATPAPTWEPPAGERERRSNKITTSLSGRPAATHPDHDRVREDQFRNVVEDQLQAKIHLPREAVVMTRAMRRNLLDFELALMTDDEIEEFAVEAAQAGSDARDELPALSNAQLGLGPPLFESKWTRASDDVFLQYGPLRDRRPE